MSFFKYLHLDLLYKCQMKDIVLAILAYFFVHQRKSACAFINEKGKIYDTSSLFSVHTGV